MWATILSWLSEVKLKDALMLVLCLVAGVGLFAMGSAIRGCRGELNFKQTVEQLSQNQVEAMKETAEVAKKLLETHQQTLATWQKMEDDLQSLRAEYDGKLADLDRELAARDVAIKEEFANKLQERAAKLREDYDKLLDDPAAARDAFYHSLDMWDDLFGTSPGE